MLQSQTFRCNTTGVSKSQVVRLSYTDVYRILVVVTICGKSPSVGIPKDVTVCLRMFEIGKLALIYDNPIYDVWKQVL